MAVSRVYSTWFQLAIDSPVLSHYDVLPGFTAVVRDMRLFFPDSVITTGGPLSQVVLDSFTDVIWDIGSAPFEPGLYSWEGRQVFTTSLYWSHYVEHATLRASGYLFLNPA